MKPWLTLTFFALVGCTGVGTGGGTPSSVGVRVDGTLRGMMHDNQTGATVTLDEVLPNAQVYAVGALADLAGEITVLAGEAWLSYPQGASGTRTETARETHAGAALLVSAAVPAWRNVVTMAPIRFADLDDAVAELAALVGVDVGGRFPFLIEGRFEDLQWHVIDGRRLDPGAATPADHLAASIQTMRERTAATLIGFYSARDEGVFTHMGSRTHVHCVVDGPPGSGHVDQVTIPAGTTVRFPVQAR